MLDLQKTGVTLAIGVVVGALLGGGIRGAANDIWNATPFSAESKLEKVRDKAADLTGKLASCDANKREYKDQLAERDRLAREAQASAAQDYGEAAARWGAQCRSAYDSGLAAGRAVGRAESKGAANGAASGGVVGGDAGGGAGGVRGRSFRDDWFSSPR